MLGAVPRQFISISHESGSFCIAGCDWYRVESHKLNFGGSIPSPAKTDCDGRCADLSKSGLKLLILIEEKT